MSKKKISRREMLKGLGLVAMGSALAACTPEVVKETVIVEKQVEKVVTAAPAPVVTVTYWSAWWDEAATELGRYIVEFEARTPTIKVEVDLLGWGDESWQKLLAAVAGGSAPDISNLNGVMTTQWAGQGALMDLAPLARPDDVWEDKFIPGSWEESFWNGGLYSLPMATDINAMLMMNKGALAAAGLDPEVPPENIMDLEEYIDALTEMEGDEITKMGMMPWAGRGKYVFSWLIPWGGKLYDPDTGLVTLNEDPKNLECIEWLNSMVERYGREKTLNYSADVVSASRNPLNSFYQGDLAMSLEGQNFLDRAATIAPLGEYAGAGTPYPKDGGRKETTYLGGASFVMMEGAQQPQAAWELLKYVNDAPQQDRFAQALGTISTRVASPLPSVLAEHPNGEAMARILHNSVALPSVTASGTLFREIRSGLEFVIAGEKTPQEMLDDVTKLVNDEIEKTRA